jgi:hypothetical protein
MILARSITTQEETVLIALVGIVSVLIRIWVRQNERSNMLSWSC